MGGVAGTLQLGSPNSGLCSPAAERWGSCTPWVPCSHLVSPGYAVSLTAFVPLLPGRSHSLTLRDGPPAHRAQACFLGLWPLPCSLAQRKDPINGRHTVSPN